MNITRRNIYHSTKYYLDYFILCFLIMLILGLGILNYNNIIYNVELIIAVICLYLIQGKKAILVIVDLIKLDIKIAEGEYFAFFDEKLDLWVKNTEVKVCINNDNIITLNSNNSYSNLKNRNVKVYYTKRSKFLVKIEAISHK